VPTVAGWSIFGASESGPGPFSPVEWYGEATSPSMPFQHASLQQPTPQEAWLFARYANGSLPFMDIGNRYLVPMAQDAGRWVVFSSPPDRFMEVFHQSSRLQQPMNSDRPAWPAADGLFHGSSPMKQLGVNRCRGLG